MSEVQAPRRTLWRTLGRIALGVLGVAAIGAIVHSVGSEGVVAMLRRSAAWMPLLLAIEFARILLESAAPRRLYGEAGRAIPLGALVRAHLVSYALSIAVPAGRASGEAYKAAVLARYANAPLAAAVATAGQALGLLAGAIVALPCAAATFARTGTSALTAAILVHVAVAGGIGFGIQAATRSTFLMRVLERRLPRIATSVAAYRGAVQEHGVVPASPLALHVCARALQVVTLGILLRALRADAGPVDALVGQAIAFVGTTAGDWIPLQLGATDGAWALSAPLLHISASDAVAVAVLAHVVQITWVAVGALVPSVWPAAPAAPAAPTASAGDAGGAPAAAVVSTRSPEPRDRTPSSG